MAAMGWDIDMAIGKLHRFWWWCVDYAPDGDLRRHRNAVLAGAVGIHPSAGDQFVKAMVECGEAGHGFIEKEPYFRVRNWWKRTGRFLQARYKADPEFLERVRTAYGASRNVVASNSQQPESPAPQTPLSPQDQAVNQPNHTKPTQGFSPAVVNDTTAAPKFGVVMPKKQLKPPSARPFWAVMVEHFKRKWEYKKRPHGRFAPTDKDWGQLRRVAAVYDEFELMALYDDFIVSGDKFYAANGHQLWVFARAVDALVDGSAWKARADKYRAEALKPQTEEEAAAAGEISQVLTSMMTGKVHQAADPRKTYGA